MAEATNLPEQRTDRTLAKAGFVFLPKTWDDLYKYAKEICQTEFVPKAMFGKPGAVLAAWQTGQEVGLPPMASLTSIALINGRPAIHSNGYWALIVSNPLCEWFKEDPPEVALKQGYGECTIKRRGNPHPITRRFSIEEAKTAKLMDKDNWKNYPGDMLQNRARHRTGDDAIPEACQGIWPADVARDLPPLEPVDVTPTSSAIQIPQPTTQEVRTDEAEPTGAANQADPGNTERPGVERGSSEARATGSGTPPRAEGETRTAPGGPTRPTLKDIQVWIDEADLPTILDNKNWAHQQLKGRTSPEQIAICDALNKRKEALLAKDAELAKDFPE